MQSIGTLLLILAAWIVLVRVILPKLGIKG